MTLNNFAIIRDEAGRASLRAAPIPNVPDDYILVRTVTVALNPTDWTTLDAPGDPGTIVGCDYAGTVEQVGASAAAQKFKKGDRVAGFAHGGNDAHPEHGAFARFIIAKADLQFHIPEHVSFEAACTVGIGLHTLGYALYKVLGLPWPDASTENGDAAGKQVLIYGGSTATGTLAIQFAKLSGYTVYTTTSPKNFDLVKQRGADAVYDYRSPTVGSQIRTATHDALHLVFDCISTTPTAAIAGDALRSSGAGTKYVSLLGPPCPRADVDSVFFLVYSASGEAYGFEGEWYDADPAFREFAGRWRDVAERVWREGRVVEHPLRIEAGGLSALLEVGMGVMREGKYSAEKLVYRVEETAWPAA